MDLCGSDKDISFSLGKLNKRFGFCCRCISKIFSDFFRKHNLVFIIFFIAFILIISVSHPQIFINDEWITTNQLSQIDQGHQFLVNEGKYGFYENNTPNKYFQSHDNLLGYSIFLPLISLPALKLIIFTGDAWDYIVITIWTLVIIFLAIFVKKYHPEYSYVRGIPWTSFLIIASFLLFVVNIIFYIPFNISQSDAPRELAAIVSLTICSSPAWRLLFM